MGIKINMAGLGDTSSGNPPAGNSPSGTSPSENPRRGELPADLFSENAGRGGYFLRIGEYNDSVKKTLCRYFDMAVRRGAVLTKGMASPSSADIEYFLNLCAKNFALDKEYIKKSVILCVKTSEDITLSLTNSFYDILTGLKNQGKSNEILKNTFIKFLCWLRRDIGRALTPSKETYPPKILCKGNISRHELLMLTAAVSAGCDVLIVEYEGGAYYSKADPEGKAASLISAGGGEFPAGFTLADIRKLAEEEKQLAAANADIKTKCCVNAWLTGDILADMSVPPAQRGSEPDTVYTAYVRINGAEEKASYMKNLFDFYQRISGSRRVLIIDGSIPRPTNEEIAAVERKPYSTPAEMISSMSRGLVHSNTELQAMLRRAFGDVLKEYLSSGNELRKGVTKAVYLISWFRRYGTQLFGGYKKGDVPCFILMGGCENEDDCLFVKLIARCPADVLILAPDLAKKCTLTDGLMYERNFTESLPAEKFPRESGDIKLGTVAYYAERELDTVMYSDTGIYRSYQYKKANAVVLRTMYEEIPMLWGEELKYRPNFGVSGDTVNIPVIMAKISGVKDKDLPRYWNELHDLYMADPDNIIVLRNEPLVTEEGACEYTVNFYKNGRIKKDAVKAHKLYKYGFLKEETQDYILDRLEAFLNADLIRDKKERGMEYRIMYIALNMKSEIVRLIQRFDFTVKNPKVIYINTGESVISQSDSILLAFLSRLGFDVVFYIPTGYQSAEKYYCDGVLDCHEAGEYMFDLAIPNLHKRIADPKQPLLKRLFNNKKK